MKWQKFLQEYGIAFIGFYLIFFFLLVTFFPKFHFNALPGDIVVKRSGGDLYIPLVSPAFVSAFMTVLIKVYKEIKS